MAVHRPRIPVVFRAPHQVEQLFPRIRPARMPGQQNEDVQFFRRERKGFPAGGDRFRIGIDAQAQRGKFEQRGGVPVGTAQQALHPRRQFPAVERFAQIIVRAGLQSLHPVFDRIPRRQKEDGDGFVLPANPPARLNSVDVGHHHIQDHQVADLLFHHPQARRSIRSLRNLMSRPGQIDAQELPHRRFIVDDENPTFHPAHPIDVCTTKNAI